MLPRWLSVENSPANAGDSGSIPGSGRSPAEGNGNPLQYSHLENPMGRGAWWAADHGVTKSRTQLSMHTHIHTHTYVCVSDFEFASPIPVIVGKYYFYFSTKHGPPMLIIRFEAQVTVLSL